jgi:uncharacterized membrane protein YdjX (TVP38/TMEM64 family)
MTNPVTDPDNYRIRSARVGVRVILWTLAWAGSMILVDKAVLYGWYTSSYISLLGVILNAALGLAVVRVFLRNLACMDELQRKIQLDSLAISMGVGLVGSFSYSLLTTTGFITHPEITDMTLLLSVTYMVSVISLNLRYR